MNANRIAWVVMACGLIGAAQEKGNDPVIGKRLFEECRGCHYDDRDGVKIGPSFKGLYKKKTLQNGKPVTDQEIYDIMMGGTGRAMPAYGDILTDEEGRDIIAYIRTL